MQHRFFTLVTARDQIAPPKVQAAPGRAHGSEVPGVLVVAIDQRHCSQHVAVGEPSHLGRALVESYQVDERKEPTPVVARCFRMQRRFFERIGGLHEPIGLLEKRAPPMIRRGERRPVTGLLRRFDDLGGFRQPGLRQTSDEQRVEFIQVAGQRVHSRRNLRIRRR